MNSFTWNSSYATNDYTFLKHLREYWSIDDELSEFIVKKNEEGRNKKMLNDRYGIRNTYPKAKKVYYDEAAGVTVVLWMDGTKTIVRAAEGDKHDAYLGYCTALAKKIHGTNSSLKRDLEKVLAVTTKKDKGNKDEKV